ncbi:MAG: YicC family protein [Rubripirellula sp.]|nr:YicC family protein [Rubripirellula sp.]
MTRVVRSMTGQGHATVKSDLGTIHIEIRTVNNRGFKCSLRIADSLTSLESKIESLARSLIHRGSVQLNLTWRRPPGEDLPRIDAEVVNAYVQQLTKSIPSGMAATTIDLTNLIELPGVIASRAEAQIDQDELWQLAQAAVTQSIDNLNQMRAIEGERMVDSLRADSDSVENRLKTIQALAPRSTDVYRNRLQSKIERVLKEHDLQVQTVDLLREVQIYADRVDISEEITRLQSHLTMFNDVIGSGPNEPAGRKLDFIIQEMFRETNTIGSKASDAEISAEVVEIKCAIERMRELVQNLE